MTNQEKNIKIIILIGLLTIVSIGLTGCDVTPVSKVSIKDANKSWSSSKQYSIKVDETVKLTCETVGSVGSIKWKSSNSGIAIVNQSGLVTGKGEGTATISIETSEGLHDEVSVSVKEEKIRSVTIKNAQDIEPGQSIRLEAEVTPEKGTNKTIVWASSDPSTISVDQNGIVTGYKVGSATITATSVNGIEGKAVISSLGGEVTFAVYPSYSVIKNNSIGWDFVLGTITIDGNKVDYGGYFTTRVGKNINCSFTVIEEDADGDDTGYFKQSVVVPDVAYGSGFNINDTITISENGGRFAGNTATVSCQMNFTRVR